ncbi:uncharacterized protein LOC129407613 isoform X8 [Boleophthalmus pectinirostris]|uniref:uncharacterized protein LOC129407613 isoform X8 n=1 Tax=Boleophthalmus pectinirostris TaxID=150288 RepID=UPI00242F0C4E|nr:uncharacterized protein LOC129407613 isoform X8 [Boleophthalmus pectinirostris]
MFLLRLEKQFEFVNREKEQRWSRPGLVCCSCSSCRCQVSPCLLLLPLSVSNAEFMDQTVKEEEDVILSCGEETRTQCESTDWIYRKDFRTTTDLFRRGQTTGEGAGTLLSDCSLHLPRVTKDQRGTYKCKQNEKEKHHILLYVASLSQRVENDRVTFNCSVASPGKCQHDFKWFNNNEEVTTDHKDLKISRSDSWCDLSVSFNDPSPPSEFYQTLKCEVKQNYPTQIFTFVPRPPVLVSVVVPVVVCVALLLICVALVLWRKLSGGGVTDGDTVSKTDHIFIECDRCV